MNEYLLKAIIRLFAIVAKGNVTDESRRRIKFMINRQASSEQAEEYIKIFDEFTCVQDPEKRTGGRGGMDAETEEFVEEWANIMLICKRINLESSLFQKIVLLLRIIELTISDNQLTEREDNLIYYISKALNLQPKIVKQVKQFVFGQDPKSLQNKNILIVDAGKPDDCTGCKHIHRPEIHGFLAILYVPEIEQYIIKYVGPSHILLNGLALTTWFIEVFPTGSNIRGGNMKPIYYSDVVEKLMSKPQTDKIQLTARDVWVGFKQERIGLRDIYLSEESGKLVGIMGASGSGKSTLLETLNGKIKPKTGEVKINGIDVHLEPEKLKGIIGFVPQDDLLIEELTVYENLYFAAKLCFAEYSEEKIHELSVDTLKALGIYDTKDLIVGNPLKKTISGGQRKRLNIGLELLREPAILFLDEPTSGLSSRDSENILDLLKELALKGKLVMTTIHQPSSDIFKMFDSLLILDVGGYQIYYGDPVDALVYFRDVVNMIQRDQGLCITCGTVSVEQVFNIIETRVVNEYGQYTDKRRMKPKDWNDQFKKRLMPKISVEKTPLPTTSFHIPNWINQFKLFYRRDLLSKLKNKQYLLVTFSEAPLLGLIIGYFIRYYNPADDNKFGYTFGNNPNIPYYFLMSIIVAMFIGLSISGEEIIKDRRILLRERFLNLSRSSYLTAKFIILLIVSAIQALLFVAVANTILEFHGMFLSFWLVLFSSAVIANIVGLNISSAFNSVITIYIMVPIILIPQLMFNGVAIEFDKLNPSISSSERVPLLGELMVSRWAYEAVMVRQFKDNKYQSIFYDQEKVVADADYKTGYYLKALETNLSSCDAALRGAIPRDSIADNLNLIKYELYRELNQIGKPEIVNWQKLTVQEFDSAASSQINETIQTLKRMYSARKNVALDAQEKWRHDNIVVPQRESEYLQLKREYSNDKINTMVKNSMSMVSIIEVGDELIRKATPIYATPDIPSNPLNFRTFYYAPEKYFAGRYFDTFWFNIIIIWIMAIFGLIALYLDLLKKFLNLIESIGDYNFRRKIQKAQSVFRK